MAMTTSMTHLFGTQAAAAASLSAVPTVPTMPSSIFASPTLNSIPTPPQQQKRQSSISISGRLKNVSRAEKEGLIDSIQKGLMKDLVISGNERLTSALDAYERGDQGHQLKRLIESDFLKQANNHNVNLFENEDLDISFLNVNHSQNDMVSFDDMSFTNNGHGGGISTLSDHMIATPGGGPASFMGGSMLNTGTGNIVYPSHYSPALHPMMNGGFNHSPGPSQLHLNNSPHMRPIQSYNSPGMHGISSTGFGFPDDFTNFNFEGHSKTFEHDTTIPRVVHLHPSPMSTRDNNVIFRQEEKNNGTVKRTMTVKKKKKSTTTSTTKKKRTTAKKKKVTKNKATEEAKTAKKSKKKARVLNQIKKVKKKDSILKEKCPSTKKAKTSGAPKSTETAITRGPYSPRARRLRIERYLQKRKHRVWTKRVKYDVRKNFADSRLRVKGRFVKKEDEELLRELMNMA